MDGPIDQQNDGWMDEWLDSQNYRMMDRLTNGMMDGWKENNEGWKARMAE